MTAPARQVSWRQTPSKDSRDSADQNRESRRDRAIRTLVHLVFHLNLLKNLSVRTKAIAAVVMPSAALIMAVVLLNRTEEQLTTARNAVLRTAEIEMQAKTSIAHIAGAAAAVRGHRLAAQPRVSGHSAGAEQRAE